MVQYHHETFEIPQGAVRLATSARCRNHAFARDRLVGMQFHPETSPRALAAWLDAYRDGPAEWGMSAEQIMTECRRAAEEQARLCDLFVGNLLRTIG